MNLNDRALENELSHFFAEDDLSRNLNYISSLPTDKVRAVLKIKSPMVLAGLPWFQASFRYLGSEGFEAPMKAEGEFFSGETVVELGELPFNIALTGERIALNLLQRASSIATYTHQFVEKANKYNIAILDTRKTTPGLRALEKYAVVKGGGHNHRYGQADTFMVKDNHKSFFGGLEKAVEFFQNRRGFYTPLIVEIHNLEELNIAKEMNVAHVMLDNFSPDQIKEAIDLKPERMTYEVSGGITLEALDSYLISGVDAISVGSLTYGAPPVDLSFKF